MEVPDELLTHHTCCIGLGASDLDVSWNVAAPPAAVSGNSPALTIYVGRFTVWDTASRAFVPQEAPMLHLMLVGQQLFQIAL